jgi:hypothetical protein
MDYKPFKDEASWIRFKERFLTTIESHGLGHIIDINHVIDNLDLDKIQRGWLYKSFKTLFKRLKKVNRDQTH